MDKSPEGTHPTVKKIEKELKNIFWMKNDLIAITLATLALIWLAGFGTLLKVTDKIKAMHRLVSFGVKFEFFY